MYNGLSHTKVKICGLKDVAIIAQLNHLAIDYIGLVFAPSKRQVSIEQGRVLVEAIHQLNHVGKSGVEAVAVCVNMPIDELKELVEQTRIDIVQLHGQEDADYIAECKQAFPQIKLWKAISIKAIEDIPHQIKVLSTYINQLDALVIDAPGGGTGAVFNWNAIESFSQFAKQHHCSLFVAGGLNEHNIEQLITHYQPDGVDVSSGVETDGVKDITKIKRFVGKVNET